MVPTEGLGLNGYDTWLGLKANRLTTEPVANGVLGPRTRELMAVTAGTEALRLKGCD